ncbi:hypothetical protein AB1Y20_009625 [Prymnesium parvum]|uniref:UBC core domain-containing protein n=1 Tax=Prymnesium parvum TaxID=97485 RepID=A0AB34K4T2_PRYPA
MSCLARLRKEVRFFEPPPYIRAKPLETNMKEWHYVLQGPPDTPYEGGLYHGKVKFPEEYPFKPPAIYMITPNGRFATDTRLCLSISDFHPELWTPTWSVASILNGVLSFMLEDEATTGAVTTTLAEKHRLRAASVSFNANDPVFVSLFPELVDGTPFQKTVGPADEDATAQNESGDVSGACTEADSAQTAAYDDSSPSDNRSVESDMASLHVTARADTTQEATRATSSSAGTPTEVVNDANREVLRLGASSAWDEIDLPEEGLLWGADANAGEPTAVQGTGKHAAKNKKKREKAAEKKRAS